MTTVFDLDGVLSRRDTMAALIGHALRGHPLRTMGVITLAGVAQMLSRRGRRRPAVHRLIISIALRGTTDDDYAALVELTTLSLTRMPGNFPPQAADALRLAHRYGTVHISTASERRMAAAYLRAVDPSSDRAVLHASSLTLDGQRPRLNPHNIGVGKLSTLQKAGVALHEVHLFTDSSSDSPLAAAVGLTTIVNGSLGTRHTITRVRAPQPTNSQIWA